MKKLIITFLFTLVLVTFVACSPKKQVESFSFMMGKTPDIVLTLTPDYSKRELNISYADKDVATTKGAVAGDYFDRFEDVVKWFYNQDIANNDKGEVKISAVSESGNKEVVLDWNDEVKNLDQTQDFYTDIVSLFSEDVY